MTVPEVRRRRLPIAELYVTLCIGLAALWVVGVAPTVTLPALLALLLPAAIVVFAIPLNVLFVAEGFPSDSWAWPLAFVVLVAVLAGLQVWMFRTVARTWRSPEPEMRRAPVTTDSAVL
jgi:uncharacterized integral membrane protein